MRMVQEREHRPWHRDQRHARQEHHSAPITRRRQTGQGAADEGKNGKGHEHGTRKRAAETATDARRCGRPADIDQHLWELVNPDREQAVGCDGRCKTGPQKQAYVHHRRLNPQGLPNPRIEDEEAECEQAKRVNREQPTFTSPAGSQ